MQKSTVIYRTQDDISKLKISLHIEEVRDDIANADEETKIFSWQQKSYGKFERDFYKDKENCVTDLEKRYHRDIINLVENDDILFTYVHEDEFSQNADKRTTTLHKRIKFQKGDADAALDHDFNFKQSLADSLNNACGYRYNFEVMHIMADLGHYVNEMWLKSEHVLCTIKYDRSKNLLLMFPDFNNFQPYHLVIDGDTKRTFAYRIQDASEKMPLNVAIREKEILNEIIMHQTKTQLQVTGTDFLLPPKNKLFVHLFFEISTASDFENDNVYVKYLIDLPENWFCKDSSRLEGSTQTSRSFSNKNLTYFGFSFEICLEYDVTEIGKTNVIKAPYVYFEVVSKDSWDRFRTEGLAYTILPVSQPGTYNYDLLCLRIVPKGPRGNLRRFFLGDYSNYDDITWVSYPKDYDKAIINKYGVDTVGTGQISVAIKVIHQSQAFISDFRSGTSGKCEKFILEKLSTSKLVKSIEQVLDAFKAAKRRMIEVRKNI